MRSAEPSRAGLPWTGRPGQDLGPTGTLGLSTLCVGRDWAPAEGSAHVSRCTEQFVTYVSVCRNEERIRVQGVSGKRHRQLSL